ncbi:hypothetical protein GCM10007968_31640 [Sporolactobacillus putidus]|uniref:Uncharacterized protein n=1 Tax=Sporolactobacillus putidus TaxID=492735 RepID=A0A917W446_9BACL|nr:hypothetical protein GCM10007968_31640 [Sporolactobacillus putidus]
MGDRDQILYVFILAGDLITIPTSKILSLGAYYFSGNIIIRQITSEITILRYLQLSKIVESSLIRHLLIHQ